MACGVLSGTSADGIDVALARFDEGLVPRLVAFDTEPFPATVASRVRAGLDGEPLDARALTLLDRDLGTAFGEAALRVARRHDHGLELVGSHGQTLWHHDGVEPGGAATLQLGDGAFLARAAGCPVVSDFRQDDVAAGGEGAPLVSILDEVLLAGRPRPVAALNLGGMANLTRLDDRAPAAFDVGPACSLLDGIARARLGRARDGGGEVAARGTPRGEAIRAITDHPYFDQPPPKSTGRDTFGTPWVQDLLARHRDLDSADLLASACEAIARSVAAWLEGARELWVAGGGVHHLYLMQCLERHCPCPVRPTSGLGLDPDGREALLFALLAARWVAGQPSTQPWATGARPGAVLGRLSPGPIR